MLIKFISKIKKNSLLNSKKTLGLLNFSAKSFSAGNTVQATKRVHGGLKDQDRIFTHVYCDTDPFIEGALKRVKIFFKFSGRLASNQRYYFKRTRLDY